MSSRGRFRADIALRFGAGAVALLTGGLWLLVAFRVVQALFSPNLAADPHGYGLIFGTIVGVPASAVCAATAPLAFPKRARRRAFTASALLFVAASAAIAFLVRQGETDWQERFSQQHHAAARAGLPALKVVSLRYSYRIGS